MKPSIFLQDLLGFRGGSYERSTACNHVACFTMQVDACCLSRIKFKQQIISSNLTTLHDMKGGKSCTGQSALNSMGILHFHYSPLRECSWPAQDYLWPKHVRASIRPNIKAWGLLHAKNLNISAFTKHLITADDVVIFGPWDPYLHRTDTCPASGDMFPLFVTCIHCDWLGCCLVFMVTSNVNKH